MKKMKLWFSQENVAFSRMCGEGECVTNGEVAKAALGSVVLCAVVLCAQWLEWWLEGGAV